MKIELGNIFILMHKIEIMNSYSIAVFHSVAFHAFFEDPTHALSLTHTRTQTLKHPMSSV